MPLEVLGVALEVLEVLLELPVAFKACRAPYKGGEAPRPPGWAQKFSDVNLETSQAPPEGRGFIGTLYVLCSSQTDSSSPCLQAFELGASQSADGAVQRVFPKELWDVIAKKCCS